jgi:integrase
MALKRARRWKLIAENPAADAEPPAPGRSPMRAPTVEELQRYLDAARGTPYWLFALGAIALGLRRSELAGLSWRNVDLERGTIEVVQVMAEAGDRFWLRPKAKTSAGFRRVSMPPVLVEELTRLRLQQKEEMLYYGQGYRRDLDLVICHPGGEPWRPNLVTRGLARIARKAGLPKWVAPVHGLRHGHASAMIASVPLKVVSERLGHSSIKITADTYMHANAELDRAAAGVIEALIRPLVTKQEP